MQGKRRLAIEPKSKSQTCLWTSRIRNAFLAAVPAESSLYTRFLPSCKAELCLELIFSMHATTLALS